MDRNRKHKGRRQAPSTRVRAIALLNSIFCIPAFFCGCSHEEAAIHEEQCRYSVILHTEKLSGDGGQPEDIRHTDIFMFNDDALRRLDSYQRTEGNGPVKAASRRGDKIMVIIANFPCSKEEWKHVNSYEGFMEEMSLLENETARDQLALILKDVCDIERIMSRVATSSATPRDLAGLRQSLNLCDKFKDWLLNYGSLLPELRDVFASHFNKIKEISDLLSRALNENPPVKLSDGGIIKPGYNAELDEIVNLKQHADQALMAICQREKQRTGIPSLKVGFNSVFGYYIEVTKTHISKVPYDYIRKQTLTGAERFVTEELKELEKKILSAEEKSLRIELSLFEEIRSYLYQNLAVLKKTAKIIAKSDCLFSLACAALNGNYKKPQIAPSNSALVIEKGRHPIVEQNIPSGSFVPNDLFLGGQGPQIILLTGPNMGGKSVFLKQTALITIMAQMGSFVPADNAEIPLTDKILTRIGAQDALSRGESTFMVEMRETANILACATPATLILLDEVGRGTSTYDGISIAWAITEFLYKPHGAGPKVLFATHYFELTELEEKYARIKNFHVTASEYKTPSGEIKLNFLFEIQPGGADKSYGVHVAEIAGLPHSCILRAKKILADLGEKQTMSNTLQEDKAPDLFSSPIVEEIKMVDLNKITPLQALQIIAEWKKRLE